ncbi:MAG: hypothetical protein ACTSPI_17085, partial [Candidatus Heimdallarchaeaceae archaeon]
MKASVLEVRSEFADRNQAVYLVKKGGKATLYAGFIIKPKKKEIEEKSKYGKIETVTITDVQALFSLLSQNGRLKLSLHRFFLPGRVRKINPEKQEKKQESLIQDVFGSENNVTEVKITYYVFKVCKEFDLVENLTSVKELQKEFSVFLKQELKQKFYSIGEVGRLTGELLEELVKFNTIDKKHFLVDEGKSLFTELAREFIKIEKNEDFRKIFLPGPAIDIRVGGAFPSPTGIESNIILGKTEENVEVGIPSYISYPLLLAGDKKIRDIVAKKILENSERFILLESRNNSWYIQKNILGCEKLILGKNFNFNILSPMINTKLLTEREYRRYLSDFLTIVKEVTESRNEIVMQIPEIIKFYVSEYQEQRDNLLQTSDYSSISINDIYTMLTSEPGGLIISDYQLASIRSIFTDISDESVSSATTVKRKKGLEALFDKNYVIDFSNHANKVQRLFIYSLLLQLAIYNQIKGFEREITILIDNAELFFPSEIERSFISRILTLFDNSLVNIILSTSYPSHLARTVFDQTSNRIIGSLRSSKCGKLIADSHSMTNQQKDSLLRLPTNSFLLLREDYYEKPILLRLFKRDIELYESQKYKKNDDSIEVKRMNQNSISSIDYLEAQDDLVPIMIDILQKLSSKVQRGINTESLPKLFHNHPLENVKNAIKLLEIKGYIYKESVEKKGRKGEYWQRITPQGKKFLSKLELQKLIESQKKVKIST